jgi:16S rRNA (guanine966-N2)-methyltransferase
MRVTTGLLKGMKIRTPSGDRVRPTKSNVREAVFNFLGQVLIGKTFTDLCSGSGSMGIEAISRGASEVFFVESESRCADIIHENLLEVGRRLGSEQKFRLYKERFQLFLERGVESDIVYCDPPYEFFSRTGVDSLPLDASVADEGLFLLEHSRHSLPKIPETLGSLVLLKTRKYGLAQISVFQKL